MPGHSDKRLVANVRLDHSLGWSFTPWRAPGPWRETNAYPNVIRYTTRRSSRLFVPLSRLIRVGSIAASPVTRSAAALVSRMGGTATPAHVIH
jgi:hypothetical protein